MPPLGAGHVGHGHGRGQGNGRGHKMERRYRGIYIEAQLAFDRDAGILARDGWVPVSQRYEPESWIAAVMDLRTAPTGELVVTYERRPKTR